MEPMHYPTSRLGGGYRVRFEESIAEEKIVNFNLHAFNLKCTTNVSGA